jgi:hypothetical protein
VGSTLHDQRKDYERKLQERDAESEKVQGTLNGVINRLQKQLKESKRATRFLKFIVHHKTEELHVSLSINHHLQALIKR